MPDTFIRTEMLLGTEGLNRLKSARVAIFGIGGVGGYTAEALARSGVGALDLIDNDGVLINIDTRLGQQQQAVAKQCRTDNAQNSDRSDVAGSERSAQTIDQNDDRSSQQNAADDHRTQTCKDLYLNMRRFLSILGFH